MMDRDYMFKRVRFTPLRAANELEKISERALALPDWVGSGHRSSHWLVFHTSDGYGAKSGDGRMLFSPYYFQLITFLEYVLRDTYADA